MVLPILFVVNPAGRSDSGEEARTDDSSLQFSFAPDLSNSSGLDFFADGSAMEIAQAEPASDDVIGELEGGEAGDDQYLNPIKKKRKSPEKPWKKPKDMPKRPLSAYNLFFKDERERLKSAASGEVSPGAPSEKGLGFAKLAKTVAAKWKAMDATTRAPYEREAAVYKEKYDKDVTTWREEQRRKKDEVNDPVGASSSIGSQRTAATTMTFETKPSHFPNNSSEHTNLSNSTHSKSCPQEWFDSITSFETSQVELLPPKDFLMAPTSPLVEPWAHTTQSHPDTPKTARIQIHAGEFDYPESIRRRRASEPVALHPYYTRRASEPASVSYANQQSFRAHDSRQEQSRVRATITNQPSSIIQTPTRFGAHNRFERYCHNSDTNTSTQQHNPRNSSQPSSNDYNRYQFEVQYTSYATNTQDSSDSFNPFATQGSSEPYNPFITNAEDSSESFNPFIRDPHGSSESFNNFINFSGTQNVPFTESLTDLSQHDMPPTPAFLHPVPTHKNGSRSTNLVSHFPTKGTVAHSFPEHMHGSRDTYFMSSQQHDLPISRGNFSRPYYQGHEGENIHQKGSTQAYFVSGHKDTHSQAWSEDMSLTYAHHCIRPSEHDLLFESGRVDGLLRQHHRSLEMGQGGVRPPLESGRQGTTVVYANHVAEPYNEYQRPLESGIPREHQQRMGSIPYARQLDVEDEPLAYNSHRHDSQQPHQHSLLGSFEALPGNRDPQLNLPGRRTKSW